MHTSGRLHTGWVETQIIYTPKHVPKSKAEHMRVHMSEHKPIDIGRWFGSWIHIGRWPSGPGSTSADGLRVLDPHRPMILGYLAGSVRLVKRRLRQRLPHDAVAWDKRSVGSTPVNPPRAGTLPFTPKEIMAQSTVVDPWKKAVLAKCAMPAASSQMT